MNQTPSTNPSHSNVAIVTGASRGIGAAIAKQLGIDGYMVVVNYINNQGAALDVVEEIKSLGGKALAIQADVSKSQEAQALFCQTAERYLTPDVLVNCAGVMHLSPISTMNDEHINQMIDVNLKGTLYTLREASQHMNKGGRIVNVSSSVVGLKLPNYAVYAATKSAVETATAIFAKELRGKAITVNSIAPGPTATDLFLDGKTDEQIEQLTLMSPLERLAQPEDIALLVSSLVSDKGAWVNGQTIRANGGIV